MQFSYILILNESPVPNLEVLANAIRQAGMDRVTWVETSKNVFNTNYNYFIEEMKGRGFYPTRDREGFKVNEKEFWHHLELAVKEMLDDGIQRTYYGISAVTSGHYDFLVMYKGELMTLQNFVSNVVYQEEKHMFTIDNFLMYFFN